MVRHRKYIKLLPGQNLDQLRVEYFSERGKVFRFSLQYEALIEGRWRIILRVDNYHGSQPHKHIFHLTRELRIFPVISDPHIAYNEWRKYILDEYNTIKENFIFAS